MAKRKSKQSRPSDQELRRGLARLKKAGIQPSTHREKSYNPSKRKKFGKAEIALFKKFKGLATGEAKAISVSPTMAKRYRKAKMRGIKLVGNKVIVPNEAGYTKLEIVKGDGLFAGMVAKVQPLKNGEIQTIVFPTDVSRIDKFIQEVKNHPEWEKLKTSKENYSFYINSNAAHQPYASLDKMIESLLGYSSIQRMIENSNTRGLHSFYEVFEVVRIRKGKDSNYGNRESRDNFSDIEDRE